MVSCRGRRRWGPLWSGSGETKAIGCCRPDGRFVPSDGASLLDELLRCDRVVALGEPPLEHRQRCIALRVDRDGDPPVLAESVARRLATWMLERLRRRRRQL